MKKKLIVSRSVLYCLVLLMCSVALPSWAEKPPKIDFGLKAPITKVGALGSRGDTYSPGHHSIAVHGADILTTWVQADSVTSDVVVAINGDNGANFFRGTKTVAKGENNPCGPSIAVASSLADPSTTIIHVAWASANDSVVKYSRSVNLNKSYSTPTTLSTPATGGPWGGSIAADDNGNVYVAWSSNVDDNIYIAKSENEGLTWGAPTIVHSSTVNTYAASIAIDNLGSVHVAWEASSEGVLYSRSDDAGATWAPAVDINVTTSGYFPSIATQNGTDIHISWYDGSGVNVSTSHDDGVSWSQSTPSTEGEMTSIAVSSDGDVNVVYDDMSVSPFKVYFVRSDDGGASWSDPYPVSTGREPNVATDQNNKAVVMWKNDRDLGDVVLFTREQ